MPYDGCVMQLDVPFIPEREYAVFLRRHADRLESVHFSLGSDLVADARNPLAPTGLETLAAGLAELPDVPKYLLMNARMQAPERYFEPAHLAEVSAVLERLVHEAGLTGVVFSDGYYLNAFTRAAPSVCRTLEAVPSVNCMIDSPPKAMAWLGLVERSEFRMPSRLVLDRGLNREPELLFRTSQAIRKQCPGLRLLLLANEGCLPHCPYKAAHDAHMALARIPGCGDRTYAMNRDVGCLSEFAGEPWRLFTSPFIRPEDVARYEGIVDGVKICGRERGGRAFLKRAVGAYVAGRYRGNLLAIMDTLGAFERLWEVRNEALPAEFHDRVSLCRKDCLSCRWCEGLSELLRKLPEMLPDLREAGR